MLVVRTEEITEVSGPARDEEVPLVVVEPQRPTDHHEQDQRARLDRGEDGDRRPVDDPVIARRRWDIRLVRWVIVQADDRTTGSAGRGAASDVGPRPADAAQRRTSSSASSELSRRRRVGSGGFDLDGGEVPGMVGGGCGVVDADAGAAGGDQVGQLLDPVGVARHGVHPLVARLLWPAPRVRAWARSQSLPTP